MQPSLKKLPPLFQQPPSQSWVPVKPCHFENLVGGSTLHQQKEWGCTLWWSKMGVANLVSGLNLNVSQECADGYNWFFACWYKCMQIKGWLKTFGVDMIKNGSAEFGDRALKLTVFEEWVDGINWFYACWYRFTKIKSWSRYFFGGHSQKWVWPVWSWESKIDCNLKNELME